MVQAENSIQLYKDPSATDIAASSIDTDLTKYTRLGWWIVIGGLGGFLLWASLAPLDKGVPLSGTVAVASNKKAIQHEVGGTVEAILVKEGAIVKAGDVLVRMNNVQAGADAETARVQYIAARTMQARLEAERDGRSGVALPKEFTDAQSDPRVLESIALQEQISSSRQAAIRSELAVISESIVGLNSQIQGLEASLLSKREQQSLVIEQLSGMRDLAKEGYMATNRVLETEQNLASINANISADMGTIARTRSQISELKLQKLQRNQEYQKEVRTQLSEAQKQASALENQLKGLDRNVSNINVKAPVAGTVVGLSVFTKGAVVAPGFKLMDIVPKEDNLVVEGQLPVYLVDKVYPGLPVNLMFTAFNQNKTPHIPGEVVNVSADRFIEEQTGQPYYKVTSKVAPEGMKLIYNLKIRPGMPVEMFVKTGERTMMNYLLRPILDHLKLSMSEE
ncbi:MAG: HlyD family type I secretion periplasmic adaptor subunit [Methylotenera sp.]